MLPVKVVAPPATATAAPRGTMVLLSGFPDTHSMWDSVVAEFQDQYRLVVASLPDMEGLAPTKKGGYTIEEVLDMFEATIDKHTSQGEQVVLVVHDWGSMFGFLLCAKRPEKISKVITLDVGANSNPHKEDPQDRILWSLWYQLNFALVFWLGLRVSELLAAVYLRIFLAGWDAWGPLTWGAKWARPKHEVKWWMLYPYFHVLGFVTRLRQAHKVVVPPPTCPVLYVYGKRKRATFHTKAWLAHLASRPECRVHAMDTSHWLMVEKPHELNEVMKVWLAA